MVSDDLWQRAQEVFDRVRALPRELRSAELDRSCAGDGELRAEVESLLEHDTQLATEFLESPAVRLRHRRTDSDTWAEGLLKKQVGQYRLRRLIAAGGMGCVFEAQQEHPARSVAVKLLRPGNGAASAVARFRTEPEFLGRLQHPNIAQVYEAGIHGDSTGPLPYFAMELVPQAQPLTEFASTARLDLKARLALFAKVCDAVQHAHQKGILHRDLKPANVLVGSDGEPKVIDFGVARATDSDVTLATQHTHAGDLIGTLRYMSPEQCDGDAGKIDTRSDIYSLGVTLYELLTGAQPYNTSGTTVYAAIRIIKDELPRRPSDVNRALRGDLDAILLKALEKEPARRYSSAAALADDLRRVLAHEPISARAPGLGYLLARFMRRHAWESAALGLALVSAVVLLSILWINSQHAAERAVLAQAAYRGALQSAEGALLINDAAGAKHQLELVQDAPRRGWEWSHLWSRADQSVALLSLGQNRTTAGEAVVDREGKFLVQLVTPGPRVEIYDLQRRVLIRTLGPSDLEQLCRRFSPSTELLGAGFGWGAAFNPSGDCLAIHVSPAVGPGCVMALLKAPDFAIEPANAWFLLGKPCGLVFHPSLPRLAAGVSTEAGYAIRIWDLSEIGKLSVGQALEEPRHWSIDTGGNQNTVLAFSSDGALLAGTEEYGDIRLWQLEGVFAGQGGLTGLRLRGHTRNLTDLAFSPDFKFLATSSADRTVCVWDVARCLAYGKLDPAAPISASAVGAALLAGPTAGVQRVRFNRYGTLVLAGDADGGITVWRRSSICADMGNEWTQANSLRGNTGSIQGLHLMSDGCFMTSVEDGTVRLWEPIVEDPARLRGHRSSVYCVAVTPDGRHAVSVDGTYAMFVWELDAAAAVARVAAPFEGTARGVACWEQEHHRLAAVAFASHAEHNRGHVVVWGLDDPSSPRVHFEYPGPSHEQSERGFYSIGVAKAGTQLAVGDASGGIHLLKLDGVKLGGAQRVQLPVHHVVVSSVEFLDVAGRWLIAATGAPGDFEQAEQHSIWIVDGETGNVVGEFGASAHQNSLRDISLRFRDTEEGENADRATMCATADVLGVISTWNVVWSGAAPQLSARSTLRGHFGPVSGLAFHPTQSRLASAGWDRTVRIWDATAGTELVALHGASGPLTQISFDSIGSRLLTGCMGMRGVDNTVLLWEDARPTPAPGHRRAALAQWWPRIRSAIQPDKVLTRPELLLDDYQSYLADVANQEDWPDEVREYVQQHFTAFIHDVSAFAAPAWAIARDPQCSAADYERALRHAERVIELDPWNVLGHTVAGAAWYRLGRYADSMRSLDRVQELCEELDRAGQSTDGRRDLAFRAMANARLGNRELAQEALQAFNEHLPNRGQDPTGGDAELLHEAERVLMENQ